MSLERCSMLIKFVLFQKIPKMLLTCAKNPNQKFKRHVGRVSGIFSILEKCVSWAY